VAFVYLKQIVAVPVCVPDLIIIIYRIVILVIHLVEIGYFLTFIVPSIAAVYILATASSTKHIVVSSAFSCNLLNVFIFWPVSICHMQSVPSLDNVIT
jgi:hypothetical protein